MASFRIGAILCKAVEVDTSGEMTCLGMRAAWWMAGLVALLVAPPLAAQAEAAQRFFFSGDGVLDLYNAHSDEHLSVRYRDADGHYDPAALAAIEHFFRSRSDGRTGPISLRLVELIDFVQDRSRPSRLTLVSGYRSPEFNQALRGGGHRVAQASLHTEGLAADLQPTGVDLRRLWLQLRELQVGGVGLYQADGFIHLDTGAPRFWEPATSGVEKNLSADNARLFARTDFDRYADLDGAVIGIHAVTALPIRIRRSARIGDAQVTIAPVGGDLAADGDCYVISEPAERYAFSVTSRLAPPTRRTPMRLQTCAPRIGATPKEIVSNPIERLP
jgi:uncharacterized protein YcbK (DUF882 family)